MEKRKPRENSGIQQAIEQIQQRLNDLNRISRNSSNRKHQRTSSKPDTSTHRKVRLLPSKSKYPYTGDLNTSGDNNLSHSFGSQKSLKHQRVSSLRVSVNTSVSGQHSTNGPVNIFNFNHYSIVKPPAAMASRFATRNEPIYISDSGLTSTQTLANSVKDFLVLVKKSPEEQSPMPTLLTLDHVRGKSSASLRLMASSAELGRRSTVCFPDSNKSWSALKRNSPPHSRPDPQDGSDTELSDWLRYTEEHHEFITRLKRDRELGRRDQRVVKPTRASRLENTRLEANQVMQKLQSLHELFAVEGRQSSNMSTQTSEQNPAEWKHTNTSFLNTVRELARRDLDLGSFASQANLRHEGLNASKIVDWQKQQMYDKILMLSREQLIFEQGLMIMQEKGVNLEDLFATAYQRVGVLAQNGQGPQDGDEDPDSSLNISGVTVGTPTNSQRHEAVQKNEFPLDFSVFHQERSLPN